MLLALILTAAFVADDAMVRGLLVMSLVLCLLDDE
jgi:hypothetical protein